MYDEFKVSLIVPDAHVGPNQDLIRFDALGNLIMERKPSRIISMGDFLSVDSLSNWDLNKSGTMEGRRYKADIESGKEAITKMLTPLTLLQNQQRRNKVKIYAPNLVFIKGNHEDRADRYLESKPELKEHINLDNDLGLKEFGFSVTPYRESVEFDGVIFTHAPMNAANQPVSGKYALHRAAEMTAKSIVFAHTHRKESVNYYRHGSKNLTQVHSVGAFFEHTDDYAYGGLNSYHRSLTILTHWADGRFDTEDISLERLKRMYL